ncbi:MAG: thiol peroxidase [Pirellulaceae bacterium]
MATTKFKGTPVQTSGNIPAVGGKSPDAALTGADLADVKISSFLGSNVVLNIFPSVDTGVCAASVRRFNAAAASLKNAKILCISRDLPFAQKRFCGAEGIANVTMLSEMRGESFGTAYGVRMVDGPLAGLLARAVVVIDATGKVAYSQLVPEIAEEPDYDAALNCLKTL